MFKMTLIRIALSILDRYLVQPIKYLPAKTFIQQRYQTIEEAANLLTDADPNNQAQLKELWEKYDEITLDDSLYFAAQVIRDKVTDKDLAENIATLLEEIAKEDLLDGGETEAIPVQVEEELQAVEEIVS